MLFLRRDFTENLICFIDLRSQSIDIIESLANPIAPPKII